MKNLILTISFVVMLSGIMSAQFGIGAGVLYGTDSEIGFTGRVNYNINSKIGIFLGYSLLASESESDPGSGLSASASLSSIDIDGHYNFSETSSTPYLLGGISLLRASVSILGISASDTSTGINIGAGYRLGMSDKFSLFGEGKYVIIDGGQAVFTVGGQYAF